MNLDWLSEAIRDENQQVDAAYVAVLWALAGALSSSTFILTMSAISYFRCYTIADVGGGIRAQVPCIYDPQPVGVAIASIFAAFAALLGALAGYMAATRRREKAVP